MLDKIQIKITRPMPILLQNREPVLRFHHWCLLFRPMYPHIEAVYPLLAIHAEHRLVRIFQLSYNTFEALRRDDEAPFIREDRRVAGVTYLAYGRQRALDFGYLPGHIQRSALIRVSTNPLGPHIAYTGTIGGNIMHALSRRGCLSYWDVGRRALGSNMVYRTGIGGHTYLFI